MNVDQVIEGVGNAVAAAKPAQEYCLFWSDYWWWMCMTKSEWAGWMQFVGAVIAVGVAFFVARLQIYIEQSRDKRLAASLILPFSGALQAVDKKLPPGGSRSLWDVRMTRMMLESELKRSDEVPLHVLTSNVQLGLYSYRLIAMQWIEALKIAEGVIDKPSEETGKGALLVTEDAYEFLQEWITRCQENIQRANELVGHELVIHD